MSFLFFSLSNRSDAVLELIAWWGGRGLLITEEVSDEVEALFFGLRASGTLLLKVTDFCPDGSGTQLGFSVSSSELRIS